MEQLNGGAVFSTKMPDGIRVKSERSGSLNPRGKYALIGYCQVPASESFDAWEGVCLLESTGKIHNVGLSQLLGFVFGCSIEGNPDSKKTRHSIDNPLFFDIAALDAAIKSKALVQGDGYADPLNLFDFNTALPTTVKRINFVPLVDAKFSALVEKVVSSLTTNVVEEKLTQSQKRVIAKAAAENK
jgi:hypothetical protein